MWRSLDAARALSCLDTWSSSESWVAMSAHSVLYAIRHRDPRRAEALMREHVHFMGLTILRHLEADAPGQLASLLSGNRGEEK